MFKPFVYKISVLVLVLIFIWAGTSFSSEKHICKAEIYTVNASDCCNENQADEKDCCSISHAKSENTLDTCNNSTHCKSDCCININTFFRGISLIQTSVEKIKIQVFTLNFSTNFYSLFENFSSSKKIFLPKVFPPPKPKNSLTILFQVFRI